MPLTFFLHGSYNLTQSFTKVFHVWSLLPFQHYMEIGKIIHQKCLIALVYAYWESNQSPVQEESVHSEAIFAMCSGS